MSLAGRSPSRPISSSSGSPFTLTSRTTSTNLPSSSPAASSASSEPFPSPHPWKARKTRFSTPARYRRRLQQRSCGRWLAGVGGLILTLSLWLLSRQHQTLAVLPPSREHNARIQEVLPPARVQADPSAPDPEAWLKKHSSMNFEGSTRPPTSSSPKAALISLVRNEELEGMLQSMRELEFHFNRRHNYPWIFFSEKPFSDEFKTATSNLTNAKTQYEVVPRAHWSTPSWINSDRYMDSLDYLGTIGVGKGWMLSYRAMCRWNSGFFYHHPALAPYQYYWRVEPDVHFFCHIPYDPFQFLRDNELVYGFNMNILEDARSFPSLWRVTLDFVNKHPEYVHPEADISWLVDSEAGGGYNNCQFFSNFEIGSLDFFRSPAHTAYFQHLDESGGFFYERFGDAPIHTLSLSLFAPQDKIWFFRDIGYQHDIARVCPPDSAGRCACEPTGLDENFYKLVPMESPQKKPSDSCIRLWLGGGYLRKKEGWSAEAERAFGGDGLGGYVREG